MKIILDGEEIEVTKIRQSKFYEVLSDKVNILLFGKSGWGKTQTVKRYCLDNGLKLKLTVQKKATTNYYYGRN